MSRISRDCSPSSLYIDFGLFLLVFSSRERRGTRHFAPQTTRLSSSSTRRLVKVTDIRLLRGKSLDTRINLMNTNTVLVLSSLYLVDCLLTNKDKLGKGRQEFSLV